MLSILASENLVRSQRALLVCSTAGPIRILNAQTNEAELYSTHAFSMFTLLNIHYQTFTLWTCSRIRSIYSDFYASPFFSPIGCAISCNQLALLKFKGPVAKGILPIIQASQFIRAASVDFVIYQAQHALS